MQGVRGLQSWRPWILMVLLAVCSVESGGPCSEKEREALLRFKQEAVETDPMGLFASWSNGSADCCHWNGILCSSSATGTVEVTALVLNNCGDEFDPSNSSIHTTAFEGALTSAALSALALGLPHLATLDLGCQLLHGSLPPEIGNLTSLSHLDLSFQAQPDDGSAGRRLSGSIPPTLGSLPHLSYIDLGYNSFLGSLPDAISNASSLASIFLTTNNLSGSIPASLANLSLLSHLDLSSNAALTLLPSSPSWSPSFSLLTLDVSWCKFSGAFPSWLASQTNLSLLTLAGNSFSGEVPTWAWSLVFDNVDLSSNQFSNHLDCSGSFVPSPTLTSLDISDNAFTGIMPCHLSNLTSISRLSLAMNTLTGRISSFIGNLTQLAFLDLSSNQFQGDIPASIEHLQLLQYLYLDDNILSGEVPAFLLQFPYLQALDLSFNLFLGNVPIYRSPSMTNLSTSLTYLKLSHNHLTGPIPSSLSKLSVLQVLRLNDNHLTGTVPKRISLLTGLQSLDVSNNSLDGPLPLAMKNMKGLVSLIVGQNPRMRPGSFPQCVKHLPELVVLDLRSTNLEGKIPEWVGKTLQQLQILLLSNNQLTGQIPASLMRLTGMRQPGVGPSAAIIASHDVLIDDLNIAIKGQSLDYFNLPMLAVLDLSGNKLGGAILEGLGELVGLVSMDLSRNSLNGSIPESLANLSKLESLDLSSNMLEGEIPQQFSDLTSLAFVNLSNNELSGAIPSGGQWGTFNASAFANNKALCISASLASLAGSQTALPECPTTSTAASPPEQPLAIGSTMEDYISWTAVGVGYPLGVLLVVLYRSTYVYLSTTLQRVRGQLKKLTLETINFHNQNN